MDIDMMGVYNYFVCLSVIGSPHLVKGSSTQSLSKMVAKWNYDCAYILLQLSFALQDLFRIGHKVTFSSLLYLWTVTKWGNH